MIGLSTVIALMAVVLISLKSLVLEDVAFRLSCSSPQTHLRVRAI